MVFYEGSAFHIWYTLRSVYDLDQNGASRLDTRLSKKLIVSLHFLGIPDLNGLNIDPAGAMKRGLYPFRYYVNICMILAHDIQLDT